jgi:predicted acyltransferase
MLLMIIVNDLWTLHDIPVWLEHTTADEDGMGLSDVVFPAFLFIVGLSVPFAIQARIKKGEPAREIIIHIIKRSSALIIMGFFMVNHEHFSRDVPAALRTIWEICMLLAFMLIWNHYKNKKAGRVPVWILQAAGILILVILALLFRDNQQPSGWMKPHWWGILGLIGWAYLLCAMIYLVAAQRLWIIVLCWLVLNAMNALEFIPAPLPKFPLVVSASNHALVMGGIMVSVIYLKMLEQKRFRLFELFLILLAVIVITYGFILRPLWGISKIYATPSWTGICMGISLLVFLFIYIVSDLMHLTVWARPFMPAGRSALTCYLLPGLLYPVLAPLLRLFPESMLGGTAGLIKSFLFAMLIILLTGLLERVNVRLKI